MEMHWLLERLERIERALDRLLEQRVVKERYTAAEVAAIVGKAEYTVREWCRKGQVPADKAPNGRGWLIVHANLERIRNGELPSPEHNAHRILDR
jgi:hypothetical protein